VFWFCDCAWSGGVNRQEVPPHLDGGASRQVNHNVQNRIGDSNNTYSNSHNSNLVRTDNSLTSSNQPTDTTKSAGQSDKGVVANLPQGHYPLPALQKDKDKDSDQVKEKN